MTQLFASSAELQYAERADRLLHAIAQLPDSVTLQIAGNGPARPGLELVTSAYGIDDRVTFSPASRPSSDAIVVYPSAQNLMVADVRPDQHDGRAVGFMERPQKGVIAVTNMAELIRTVSPGGPARTHRGDDAVLAGHRIALLTNRMTHYRVPLWNRVAKRLAAAGAELRVFFTAGTDAASPWMVHEPAEFDHVWLRPAGGFLTGLGPLDLGRQLGEFRPTLIVSGGYSPQVTARAATHALRHGPALGIWSGEVPWGRTAASRVRRAQRRATATRLRFALSYGSAATDYVHGLMPTVPQVVVRNSSTVRTPNAERSGTAGPLQLLAVGQAIHRKGLDVVIDAVRMLGGEAVHLVVAGGGDQLDSLRERARGLTNVDVLGPVGSDEVGALYAQADVFLFPTRFDVFGLVLVESLSAGLPTIVSAAAGATADLVADGGSGLRLSDHDPRTWADAIVRLVENSELRERIGVAGRRMVADRWSLDHSADAWIAGLRLGALSAH